MTPINLHACKYFVTSSENKTTHKTYMDENYGSENIGFVSSRGARCSSVVRAFAHGAMGCRIDPSWDGPIELFLVPASAQRLV